MPVFIREFKPDGSNKRDDPAAMMRKTDKMLYSVFVQPDDDIRCLNSEKFSAHLKISPIYKTYDSTAFRINMVYCQTFAELAIPSGRSIDRPVVLTVSAVRQIYPI